MTGPSGGQRHPRHPEPTARDRHDNVVQNHIPLSGAVRVVLRPLASPLPIGFLALAVGSLVYAGFQLHWTPITQQHTVALAILAFVVPLQFVSAILGVLARDGVGATAMAVLSATWAATGAIMLSGPPGVTNGTAGLLLIGAAAVLTAPAAAAVSVKPLAAAVISLTILRFATGGLYQLTSDGAWQTAAAVIGLVLGLLAGYAGLALLLEDVHHRPTLPTFRRDPPPDAPRRGLDHDTQHLSKEAGIRSPA